MTEMDWKSSRRPRFVFTKTTTILFIIFCYLFSIFIMFAISYWFYNLEELKIPLLIFAVVMMIPFGRNIFDVLRKS